MDRRDPVWIVVADARLARLMCCPDPQEQRRLQTVDELHEQWDEKEHHRPQPLGSRDGHAYAAYPREDEERLHRHAKRLEQWLGRHRQQHHHAGGRWTLVAPPRLLGELRQTRGAGGVDQMKQVEAQLTDLSPTQLAQHPALAEVLR
jgi:protein required for attachment to host cells